MYLWKSVLITEQNMNISEAIDRRYNRRRSVGCERNIHSDWMFNDVLHSSQCCKILLEPFQEDGLYLLAPSHCHSKTTLVHRTIWMFYWFVFRRKSSQHQFIPRQESVRKKRCPATFISWTCNIFQAQTALLDSKERTNRLQNHNISRIPSRRPHWRSSTTLALSITMVASYDLDLVSSRLNKKMPSCDVYLDKWKQVYSVICVLETTTIIFVCCWRQYWSTGGMDLWGY